MEVKVSVPKMFFSHLKKVVQFFLILLFFVTLSSLSGCRGTEVLNPPTQADVVSFEGDGYQLILDLLFPGWSYIEYGPGVANNNATFQDIDPETITVAEFSKNSSHFVLFFSRLSPGETPTDFIRKRHPTGAIYFTDPSGRNDPVMRANYIDASPGPNGGSVEDQYTFKDRFCVWFRIELVGTEIEKANLKWEFGQILNTLKIKISASDGSIL